MAHKDVFEHIAGNRIDAMPFPAWIHNVNHARLLLVALAAFAIQIVKRQSDLCAKRQRLNHANIS